MYFFNARSSLCFCYHNTYDHLLKSNPLLNLAAQSEIKDCNSEQFYQLFNIFFKINRLLIN